MAEQETINAKNPATPGTAFLFDLDGTLVDSVYQHVLAWREALEAVGIELAVWRIHRRVGMSGGLMANALLRETGHRVSAEEADRLLRLHAAAYARQAKQIQPLPGARELLAYLTQQRVPWTIATSGRMESARPTTFRQSRVGREGHIFTTCKFRTMFMRDLNEDATDLYTRDNDPRVTRTGSWLRKLRLDELPQLWNVFKGDMSLIGPRAEWTKCAERYEQIIPFYHFRHLVKPGITGWAQVNYPYGESDEDAVEKLQYDLYYIRHYSLKLDAMIVLKTVHTMLFGKGR